MSPREPGARLIVGTVAVAVAGILGLGAIVYQFTGPDAPEQAAAEATADAAGDDSAVVTEEAAAPGVTAGADVTEEQAVPGAATPSAQQGITANAFCSPVGAAGKTSTGLSMRCIRALGDARARWRPVVVKVTTAPATKAATTPATTAPAAQPTAHPTTKPATVPTTKPTTPPPVTPTTTAPPVTETTTTPVPPGDPS